MPAETPSKLEKQDRRQSNYPSHSQRKDRPILSSPLTIVNEGNSDPFAAYPIQITAEMNNLIAFYRDYVLPAMWLNNFRNMTTLALADQDWKDNISTLEEEGTAYGTLARHGMMAAAVDPATRKLALELVGRSTQILRRRIEQDPNLHESSMSTLITMHTAVLCIAETLGRNMQAAMVHGAMLVHLFEQQWTQHRLDYKLLLWETYNDCQLTSMFLCRPIFDVDQFLPKVFRPLWAAAAQHLPEFPASSLDSSIDNEELRAGFQSRQEQLSVYGLKTPRGSLFLDVPDVFVWYMSKAWIFHGRMVNHYLNIKEHLLHTEVDKEVKDHLYTQQYLALAAVYLTRTQRFNFNPKVLGIPMFDASIIPRTLRTTLEQSDISSQRPTWTRYVHARLWAYYVGALDEQAEIASQSDSCAQWFSIRLCELAGALGLTTWVSLRGVLRGFLYSDILTSQGAEWFETLMRKTPHKEVSDKG